MDHGQEALRAIDAVLHDEDEQIAEVGRRVDAGEMSEEEGLDFLRETHREFISGLPVTPVPDKEPVVYPAVRLRPQMRHINRNR